MQQGLLQRFLVRTKTTFFAEARSRGLSARVSRALESAAYELYPEDPLEVFELRERFEEIATHAVTGDAGNLELSYGLVDDLASAVEKLGLARESDVPDPFRRVWISSHGGDRIRGVVLRCAKGEVAVFCPPGAQAPGRIGEVLRFDYRSFRSAVGYDLYLNDSVRLPEALVLHLNRPDEEGAIGREQHRHEIRIEAGVRGLGDLGSPEWSNPRPCMILDVSLGGMRIASNLPFGRNHAVEIEFASTTDEGVQFLLPAVIAWNREDPEEGPCQGLELEGVLPEMERQYQRFIRGLERSASDRD